jgi:hypothetical protein
MVHDEALKHIPRKRIMALAMKLELCSDVQALITFSFAFLTNKR